MKAVTVDAEDLMHVGRLVVDNLRHVCLTRGALLRQLADVRVHAFTVGARAIARIVSSPQPSTLTNPVAVPD
jgi:hypothetical protein